MKVRFFWLLSDRETVREISRQDWMYIVNKEWRKNKNTRLVCRVDESEVYVRKGGDGLWIPKRQLKGILS